MDMGFGEVRPSNTEGGVWCAIWDGWSVVRFSPDGSVDMRVNMPVPRATSLCFGGDDNDVLFITSARTRLPASTLSKANWMGRAGHVDEMVGAALFLSTQASSFMTGEVLTLSGGY
ncbi:SMP-30/gluconolactonase/LRE family protein [Parasphingorhabdus sp.]|jgi:NAD(P)-dependent dehydrogenase (short-subunit alcohol dehydrogenase family)|uniref:SMP-30/gluconolactonase/LRE family protein n=1 Tax=Parasphingorhabdus sp. TaxID=2709688 RepID=UPI0030EE902B